MSDLDRQKVGEVVLETALMLAQGYRDAVTTFDDEARRETSARCAVAAHNTGWFILKALGFSKEEIEKLGAVPAWKWSELALPRAPTQPNQQTPNAGDRTEGKQER